MTTDVQDRSVIRRTLAQLLQDSIEGAGKPVQKVFPYRVGDFRGKYAVVAVASAPANRSKQAQVTRVSSMLKFDVHCFVLYADSPLSIGSVAAGSNRVLSISDTSNFVVGEVVAIENDLYYERPTVTAINPNVSITVDALSYSYDVSRSPKLYWWNEEHAEDRADLVEKSISDVVMDHDSTELWAELSFDGDTTPDVIQIGGKEYLHEIIHLACQLHSD